MSSTDVPERTVPPIAWEDWTPGAFARAKDEGRPVLLSISANWCHGCAVMDNVAYGDSRVADLVAREFVAVRIDADRRPDINDRYNLDGWPTTALLTPSGEILTGSTYLPADALLSMLTEVATAYRTRRESLDERADAHARARQQQPRARATGVEPDLAAPAWVARQVIDQCDPDHGGFGADGKFLHVPALHVAVAEYERTQEEALARAITRTLDGMADGDVHDQVDGGFFRYAAGRDWSRPHTEKLLDDQAGIAGVYLEAARVFGHDRWRDVAIDTIRFVARDARVRGGRGLLRQPRGRRCLLRSADAVPAPDPEPAARRPHEPHRRDGARGIGVDPRRRAAARSARRGDGRPRPGPYRHADVRAGAGPGPLDRRRRGRLPGAVDGPGVPGIRPAAISTRPPATRRSPCSPRS